jgi:hypothetical protein
MASRNLIAAFALMAFVSTAAAEDQLSVAVYPGAKYDQDRTDLLKESIPAKGAAYRTGDDIAKVIAFYRGQGLLYLKIGGSAKEVARFKKVEADVDVVVQNPWKDAKTGKTMTDTLILIFKKEEKGGPDIII